MKFGIDIGGSHIGIGIVDNEGKIIIKKEQDYFERKEDMSKLIINMIFQLMDEIIIENKLSYDEIEAIGITIPGIVSKDKLLIADNLGIKNFDIKSIIQKKYNVPIKLENDATCAAIAEKKFGSIKEYKDALFLVAGTGVGGAIFLNDKLLESTKYSAFEVGHMVIDKNGEKCACGRNGCFDVLASIKRFKLRLKNEFELNSIDGSKIKDFIVQNIENEKLLKMIDEYIDNLSIGIINLINIFGIEVVSIGGGFVYFKDIFLEKLQKRIIEKNEIYNKEIIPKILVADLKNDAGIIGAAML